MSARPVDVIEITRYDTTSVILHWITALLVIALWCLGQTIDWFPTGSPRIAARSTHVCLGVILAVILCYRIGWRALAGQRLPGVGSNLVQWLSRAVHWSLYLMLVVVVVLGLFNEWVRGDNIFNLFKMPAFDPTNRPLRQQVGELHALSANVLLVLAGLHAAAGLWHHFIVKDAVLRRMSFRR